MTKSATKTYDSGAIRSTDADGYDFAAMPLIGVLAVARTIVEGQAKYGRFNWMKGLPIDDTINHIILHYVLFLLGDRSEPHLEHAACGALMVVQEFVLNPESQVNLLGPGATLTDSLLKKIADHQCQEPSPWNICALPEVARIIKDHMKIQVKQQTRDEVLESLAKDEPLDVQFFTDADEAALGQV